MTVTIRSALVKDARPILDLVNRLALDQVMLPRSPASVIENLRDFAIAEVDGAFAGAGALSIVWSDLAEVRSLAVDPAFQGHGVGRALVAHLVAEARELGIPRLFCFTYVPEFFARNGFVEVDHEALPHKVFNDCLHCPKFHACDEIAMERWLDEAVRSSDLPRRPIPMPQHTGPGGRPRRR